MAAVRPASVQRSFRLSLDTSDLLDEVARATNESRNALADRLLREALRGQWHPLVGFRTGAARRREPHLVGSRLLVRQVVATVRDHDGDVDEAAAHLAVPARFVRAALAYYAEFRAEVDADAAWAGQVEAEERARWEREQAPLT